MAAGRPTDMTDEVLAIIEQGIIDGKPLKDLAEPCGVSESALYEWTYKNYGNFKDKLENWKLKAKLKKAESRAEEILSLPLHDSENKIDPSVLRTVQKEAEFLRKTLAKDVYSDRSEITGKDGKDLTVTVVNYADAVQLPTKGLPNTTSKSDR